MVWVDPGRPDAEANWTPATLPTRASDTLVDWVLTSSSLLRTLAEPVKASFVVVPNATTIVSSSCSESGCRATLIEDRPPTSISWLW